MGDESMKKKLLAMLLVLAMAICLLPATAFAASATSVYVGGVELTSATPYSADGGAAKADPGAGSRGASYALFDSATATLTLCNVTTGAGYKYNGNSSAIYAVGDLTIRLVGTNAVTGTAVESSNDSYGVFILGTLTIEDDPSDSTVGSLTATGASGAHFGSFGIAAFGVTIAGGAITAIGGEATGFSYGIYSLDPDLHLFTISGGSVVAKTTGSATNKRAFSTAPTLSYPSGYHWSIDELRPNWTASGDILYTYAGTQTYVSLIPTYKFNTPAAVTVNGLTASVSYSHPSPYLAGTNIQAKISLVGTAALTGTHTIGISSNKAGMTVSTGTFVVTRGEEISMNPLSSSTFILPAQDVDDFTLTHTFTVDYTMDFTAAYAQRWAGGKAPASENCSGAGWDWKYQTKTLTLSGLDFTTTAETAMKLPGGTTIVLADGKINTIEGGPTLSEYESCYGIFSAGKITIKGGGTLTATGGGAPSTNVGKSVGIATDSELAIESGVIKAFSRAGEGAGVGLWSKGSISVTGGTILAAGGAGGVISSKITTAGMAVKGSTDRNAAESAIVDVVWSRTTYYVGSVDYAVIAKAIKIYHIPVAGIAGVPATATAGTDLTLKGTVSPSDAVNKTIVWSVKSQGTTGAAINGSTLSTTSAGTVTVTATVVNGKTATTDYTEDFIITVSAAPAIKYNITKGASGGWIKGGSSGLGFTADAEFDKFTGVSIDGTAIGSDKFTAENGSTKVALLPAYLETLSVGKHILRVNFTDGYAETSFTIAATSNIPATGDSSMLWLWMGLAALAVVGLAGSIVLSVRKRRGQN